MQHDFIYNFLLVKDLLYDFDLCDSEEFSKIINLNLEDFFNKIYKVRKFNLLRINLS